MQANLLRRFACRATMHDPTIAKTHQNRLHPALLVYSSAYAAIELHDGETTFTRLPWFAPSDCCVRQLTRAYVLHEPYMQVSVRHPWHALLSLLILQCFAPRHHGRSPLNRISRSSRSSPSGSHRGHPYRRYGLGPLCARCSKCSCHHPRRQNLRGRTGEFDYRSQRLRDSSTAPANSSSPGLIDGYAGMNSQGQASANLYMGVTTIVARSDREHGLVDYSANPRPNIVPIDSVGTTDDWSLLAKQPAWIGQTARRTSSGGTES